jgi:hypothetical protein
MNILRFQNFIIEGKKVTTEDFIEKAKKVHGDKYDYSKVNYINNSTPIEIICPNHGSFTQRPDNHLLSKGCKKCGVESMKKKQSLNSEYFVKKGSEVHNNKYDYSKVKYVNAQKPIEIICPIHGLFTQSAGKHLSGDGCPSCGGSKRLNNYEFIEKSKKVHGDKYEYSKVEYSNNIKPVEIICPIHGNFKQSPGKHMSGNGCPKCGGKLKSNTEDFIKKAKIVHHDKYNYSKVNYINNITPIQIICPMHGDFTQRPTNHLLGKGCSICRESKGEVNVQKTLSSLGVKFIRLKRFDDCIGLSGKKLIFDFYLPDYNLCIEYDGEQHFRPVSIWAGDEGFKNIQRNDKIKDEYCKKNGINLLRISYKISGYEKISAEVKRYLSSLN